MAFRTSFIPGATPAAPERAVASFEVAAVSQQLAQSFVQPPGKLCLLYGDALLFRLSLLMAAQAVAKGGSFAVVDGGNHFNVHVLSRFAQERKLPPGDFLDRIFISRGFTCYQMEQAIVHRLPSFLHHIHSMTAMVFGLLDTCYDQQAPFREVRQILQRVLGSLQQMKADGVSVLVACTEWNVLPAERNQLFETVRNTMDQVYRLEARGGNQPTLFLEKGVVPHGAHRANVYEHHRQRDSKLVEVSPRSAERGPGSFR